MHRSTLLYIGMLVLLGSGLEGIRRVGNTLTPPRHIAGAWRLTVPPASSSCPLLEFGEAGDDNLQVEQSGRYLTLTFTDVHHTRLRARFDGRELYGSGSAEVARLQGLRDQVLLKTNLGRAFVNAYYRTSPKIIPLIRSSNPVRLFFRMSVAFSLFILRH